MLVKLFFLIFDQKNTSKCFHLILFQIHKLIIFFNKKVYQIYDFQTQPIKFITFNFIAF